MKNTLSATDPKHIKYIPTLETCFLHLTHPWAATKFILACAHILVSGRCLCVFCLHMTVFRVHCVCKTRVRTGTQRSLGKKEKNKSPLVLMVFLHRLQNSFKNFLRLRFSDSLLSWCHNHGIKKKPPIIGENIIFETQQVTIEIMTC